MSYENPSKRVLPVAQIYSFERIESIGLEVLVSVKVGDAENFPHLHGLRAPAARWVEIFRALAGDESLREQLAAALESPTPFMPSPPRTGVPVVLSPSAPSPFLDTRCGLVAAAALPASADPENAFYRRPITKPNGSVL